MSRHAHELCTLLVDDTYGELTSQHLVLWYTLPDDRLTLYEANTAVAYSLVRSGKYIKVAETQAGGFAGKVISDLLLLGHARVGDLVQAYDADNRSEAEKVVPNLEEYKAKSKREREAQHEAAVKRKLQEWRYRTDGKEDGLEDLKKGKKRVHHDPATRWPEKRQRVYSHSNQDVASMTREVYQPVLERTGYLDINLILRVNHAMFALLTRNEFLVELADRTISASTAGVYAQVLRALEPNLQYCREESENSNVIDAEVCRSSSRQVSTDDIVGAIKDSSKLADALGQIDDARLDMAQFDHPKKQRKKDGVREDGKIINAEASPDEKGDASDLNGEDSLSDVSSDYNDVNGEARFDPNALPSFPYDPHRDIIRNHLLVLATHPLSFLNHLRKTSVLPERWTIDFPTLMENVTHHTILETIASRHGLPAARLTRILFDKGKTDEKVLCSTSLLAQKAMRSYLLPLHKAGMIGLQEVPRDNSRNPQRTNFLWFFDPGRCKAKILEETYKTMARCLRRARIEGEKVKGTMEKASRSDVIGREAELLSVQELEALNVWRKMDERIWGEISRLDDLVACLRDF